MGDSAAVRLDFYTAAVHLWATSPVFGHGIGSWPVLAGYGDQRAYPHNILLEIAVELGLVGLVLFVGLLAFALRALGPWHLVRQDPIRVLILMLFASMFINALVSGDLSYNRPLFAVLGLMAVAGKEQDP
jgi:O-antigen ligase